MAIRLAIFMVPSPRLDGWRAAIVQRATDLHWAIATAAPGDGPDSQGDNHLLITSDMATLDAFAPDHCVVLQDTPDASLAVVTAAAVDGLRANEVRGAVSAPWAAASQIAGQGATVVKASSGCILFPGLGSIEGPQLPPIVDSGPEKGALAVFDTLPVQIGATAIWTPAQFDYPFKREFFGGTPEIDLTGRPRGLVYGPFIHLPPGTWQVDVDISVDPERGQVPLRFDWGCGEDFTTVVATVNVPGRYSLSLVHRWEAQAPVQMRIWLTEGIFQGRLTFNQCRVTRVSDDTPPTTNALG